MTNSPKTNISYTNDVFANGFVEFNPTKNKYDVDCNYLLDSLIIQLDNTKYLYDLLSNNRIKVKNIAFFTLKDLIDLNLKLNYGNCYYASNYQIEKIVKEYQLNDILNDLVNYINDTINENHLRKKYEVELFFENKNQEIITSTSYDNQSVFFSSLTAAKKEYAKLKAYYKRENKHTLKKDIEYNVISLNDIYNNNFTVVKSDKLI